MQCCWRAVCLHTCCPAAWLPAARFRSHPKLCSLLASCSPILHHVRLSNLKPGQTYFYIVGGFDACCKQPAMPGLPHALCTPTRRCGDVGMPAPVATTTSISMLCCARQPSSNPVQPVNFAAGLEHSTGPTLLQATTRMAGARRSPSTCLSPASPCALASLATWARLPTPLTPCSTWHTTSPVRASQGGLGGGGQAAREHAGLMSHPSVCLGLGLELTLCLVEWKCHAAFVSLCLTAADVIVLTGDFVCEWWPAARGRAHAGTDRDRACRGACWAALPGQGCLSAYSFHTIMTRA